MNDGTTKLVDILPLTETVLAIDTALETYQERAGELPLAVGFKARRHLHNARHEIEQLEALLIRGWVNEQVKEKQRTAGIQPGREMDLNLIARVMSDDGITREQLAERLGLSVDTVANTLRPSIRVSLERALAYARALGIPLDQIVDLD